jgi:hypothetical protein
MKGVSKDYVFFVIVTAAVSGFFLVFCSLEAIRQYNISASDDEVSKYLSAEGGERINFAVHDFVQKAPAGVHLLVIPVLLALVVAPKNYIISATFFAFYGLMLAVSILVRMNRESPYGVPYGSDVTFLRELYRKTWMWDYVGVAYFLLASPWLVSLAIQSNKSKTLE